MPRPIQVYLDDADAARLETWARQRGWTKSRAIRLAVRALTRAPAEDPVLELSGMFEGLPPDVSEHFDRHLNATYVAEHGATYRTRARRRRPALRR